MLKDIKENTRKIHWVVYVTCSTWKMKAPQGRQLTSFWCLYCWQVLIAFNTFTWCFDFRVWLCFRPQPSEVLYKKAVLRYFVMLTEKHLCWSLFLITLQASWQTSTPVFSCEYCEICKNTYFEEHLRMPASAFCMVDYFLYCLIPLVPFSTESSIFFPHHFPNIYLFNMSNIEKDVKHVQS